MLVISKDQLVSSDNDLESMYKRYSKGGLITLWCDGKSEENLKRKRSRDKGDCGRREEREEEVDTIYKRLLEKHGSTSNYETPQLRLWSRMISSGLHSDYDAPPRIPAFGHGRSPRRPRQESLSDALAGAAVAVVQALTPSDNTMTSPITQVALSPGETITLRMKSYEQLQYLQKLRTEGVLIDTEYVEQKENVLTSLRKLP